MDYVYALSKADSYESYLKHLKQARYEDGQVSYYHRKHFFTDWTYKDKNIATDITTKIFANSTPIKKSLNQQKNGGLYLQGINVVEREISYIPTEQIANIVNKLQNGDVIGIYTDIAGLDVTHIGFFIHSKNGAVFRHASSKRAHSKVIDVPFQEYMKTKKGIIVFRLL